MSRQPLSGPEVWTGDELVARGDWLHRIDTGELDEVARAAAGVAGRDLLTVTAEEFPLPTLAPRLAAVADGLERGCGVAVLRGLDPARLGLDGLRAALWGIGAHLGTALSQSARGEFLGEVRDYGEQLGQATSRGYRTNAALRFHTDRCDVIALACARQCREGGANRIVSTPMIHNVMLERRPDLLEELFGNWFHSRQGEEHGDERRFYESPVFAVHRGRFTCQYSRAYVESAQKFDEVPRLRPEQDQALDLLAALAEELAMESRMQDGDLVMFNNHVTFHSRTAIVDWDEPDRKRLLYRVWLAVPNSRELPQSFAELWGDPRAGAIRGGVTPPDGCKDIGAWRAARAKHPTP